MKFHILSESWIEAVLGDQISLETHEQVMAFASVLREAALPGMQEVVPTYTTVSIFFDPQVVRKAFEEGNLVFFSPARAMLHKLEVLAAAFSPSYLLENTRPAAPTNRIEVRYNGPDLSETADRLQMSENELIRRHSAVEYRVFMTGFLPGFPYLGILPEELRIPRLDTPRQRVPAGSVAIAGKQTGIYPQEAPGGWRLIGQTDFLLFDIHTNPPARLQAGTRVKFVPI
ncbi:MAG: 5-oxoprolinase subunit PxpB [Saprospiraceae bacterium]|nr:5-oxoprolinase subunit PxpB [Saprospiraceae bacterium]